MVVLNKLLHLRIQHMGIDLRRCNICMPQQSLHSPQICAAFQKMRGESMTQAMRRDTRRVETRVPGELFEELRKSLTRHVAQFTGAGKEEAVCSVFSNGAFG